MKAALYTRVSTDEQVEKGFSLEAQKRRLMEYCIKNNYEIYKLYSDEGISGHSISKRKSLQEMLQDAREKKFDCVVVYKTDRLSRNLLDLLTIKKELDAADIELIMSDESVDTSDDTGMAMFSIMGAFAELERKKISERLMSGKRQKMRTTGIKPKHGVIPYAYIYDDINKQYIVDERYRQDIIRMYEMYDAGSSYNEIAQYMVNNNLNFGRSRNRWHASDIPRVLKNPTYKGWTGISYYNHVHTSLKYVNDTILVKATNVEPIVSEELWDRVNSRANIKSTYFVRKYPSDVFIFAGLLYCSSCGYRLSTNQSTERVTKNGKVRYFYYECNSKFKIYTSEEKCPGFNINKDSFEAMFKKFISGISSNKKFSKKYSSDEATELVKKRDSINYQITTKNRQREILLEKLSCQTITDDDFKLMSNKLVMDIQMLAKELETIEKSISTISDKIEYENAILDHINTLTSLIKTWDIIPNEEKKLILHKCIKRIYVNRSGITKIEFI
ncbi:MAG: recombinase family protein [Anaeroplasma bactoclasticum]|nr:recombinase family protein [Anaeroplasma bactoclasticum]